MVHKVEIYDLSQKPKIPFNNLVNSKNNSIDEQEIFKNLRCLICQGQSVNVFVPADVNIKELHDIHMLAWKKKLKTILRKSFQK